MDLLCCPPGAAAVHPDDGRGDEAAAAAAAAEGRARHYTPDALQKLGAREWLQRNGGTVLGLFSALSFFSFGVAVTASFVLQVADTDACPEAPVREHVFGQTVLCFAEVLYFMLLVLGLYRPPPGHFEAACAWGLGVFFALSAAWNGLGAYWLTLAPGCASRTPGLYHMAAVHVASFAAGAAASVLVVLALRARRLWDDRRRRTVYEPAGCPAAAAAAAELGLGADGGADGSSSESDGAGGGAPLAPLKVPAAAAAAPVAAAPSAEPLPAAVPGAADPAEGRLERMRDRERRRQRRVRRRVEADERRRRAMLERLTATHSERGPCLRCDEAEGELFCLECAQLLCGGCHAALHKSDRMRRHTSRRVVGAGGAL